MKKKLSALFSNRSLTTQVIIADVAVIAILTVMAVIFMRAMANNYVSMLNSQLSTILEISSDSVQDAIDNIEEATVDFMTDEELQQWFKSFGQGETYSYDDFVASSEMNKYILDFVNDNQAVKFAVLLDGRYRTVVSAMGANAAWSSEKTEFIKDSLADGERYRLIEPSKQMNELLAVRAIADLSDPKLETVGYLIVGVDIGAIVSARSSNLNGYSLYSLIMFEDDVLYTDFVRDDDARMFIKQVSSTGSDETEITFGGESYFCSYKEMNSPGWEHAVYIPRSEIFGAVDGFVNAAVIIFIALVLLLLFGSYRAAKRMMRPLGALSEQMKKVQTGVFEGVDNDELKGRNEISSLARDFNTMVKRIDTLIQENYLEKMLLQESELKLLQSQINPHFLYNTLESINWMAKAGRTKEISVMVQALSKLFRNAVNNKETAITVREELDLLLNYITIQKIRFEERLETYIDIGEEFLDYKIPKFILQPLVENSIKYALELYSTACVIKVYARRAENGVKMYIEDNGSGIKEEQLKKIRANEPLESRSGIALKNIRRRLEIMYRSDNVMEFISSEGRGTTIIINIPESAV